MLDKSVVSGLLSRLDDRDRGKSLGGVATSLARIPGGPFVLDLTILVRGGVAGRSGEGLDSTGGVDLSEDVSSLTGASITMSLNAGTGRIRKPGGPFLPGFPLTTGLVGTRDLTLEVRSS